MQPWTKKYTWRITWPGEGHEDYSAYDGDLYIGRVFRDQTSHTKQGMFRWAAGAHGREFRLKLLPHNGWEQEHWQAAKAVEDYYDRLRAYNGLPPSQ